MSRQTLRGYADFPIRSFLVSDSLVRGRLLLLAFVCHVVAAGLPNQAYAYGELRLAHLDMEHGLSQSSIQAVVQDNDGFIWIGTQYGLNRYNGYHFHTLDNDPEDQHSLSDSRIQNLHLGRDGAIWVVTGTGLDRLTPETGHVDRIQPRFRSVMVSTPAPIREDRMGNLLVPAHDGVYVLAVGETRLHKIEFPVNAEPPRVMRTTATAVNAGQGFWVANGLGLWSLKAGQARPELILASDFSEAGAVQPGLAMLADGQIMFTDASGVRIIDPDSREILERISLMDKGYDSNRVDAVAVSDDGIVWLLLPEALVCRCDKQKVWHTVMELPRFNHPLGHARNQLEVVVDEQGKYWLSGQFGVVVFDLDQQSVQFLEHDSRRPGSLQPTTTNVGYKLFLDDQGNVWIGSGLGGISRFSPQSSRFKHIHEPVAGPPGAGENIVRALHEQVLGDQIKLWSGLDGAGLRLWVRGRDGRFELKQSYRTDSPESRRLPDDFISGIAVDPISDNVWIASQSGISTIDPESGAVIRRDSNAQLGLPGSAVAIRIARDARRLWIATSDCVRFYGFGADRIELVQHNEYCASAHNDNIGRFRAFDLFEARNGQLMATGRGGLLIMSADGQQGERHLPGGEQSGHPGNYIFSMTEHPEGVYWLGSRRHGLARFEPGVDQSVRWFTDADGLSDNTVYAIEPDDDGMLWISSNRGLTRFDPDRLTGRRFSTADGLQSLEFNNTVSQAGSSGTFYFGGINGVNAFVPGLIADHSVAPRLHLEHVEINGKAVSTEHGKMFRLEHDQNYVTIDYVGLHYSNPERNQYAYRLEGLEDEWVEAGSSRQARYPELAPGQYRFLVRAANSDGVWSAEHELLRLQIRQPPWLAPAALAIYVFIVMAIIALIAGVIIRRRRVLEALVLERTRKLAQKNRVVKHQARELEEMLEARTMLFANVSHEFRTPLTLIGAALEQLEKRPDDTGSIMLARRYQSRLLRLVNQLLDLSRLRLREAELESVAWSMKQMTEVTVEAFESLARSRGIKLWADLESGWVTRCAQGHVEKILLNLLSNAIKFTPSGGWVRVTLTGQGAFAVLTVSDSGVGIAEDKQAWIFERFHRVPASEENRIEGAGIGLALVREAARAIGGSIELDSMPGKGSSFQVRVPAQRQSSERSRSCDHDVSSPSTPLELESVQDDVSVNEDSARSHSDDLDEKGDALGTLLLVEDNSDLRQYLAGLLQEEWIVLQASNGHEAIALSTEQNIDIIVSDIMMPEMDGLELLSAIRDDIRTSHIPMLILTARQDDETWQRGLELSADEILGKPFDAEQLRLKLRNIMDSRRRVRDRIMAELQESIGEGEPENAGADRNINRRDRQFLHRVETWLESHFSDPDVTVSRMADDLAMDARTLQRKLRVLVDHSPGSLLQSYRLREACRLLAHSDIAVQQVAINCGFSSAQYFSRAFASSMGSTPTAWRETRRSMGGA